jgi:uncharacterized RDD family membrane protein YckC
MDIGSSRRMSSSGRRVAAASVDLAIMATLVVVGTLFLWMVATGGSRETSAVSGGLLFATIAAMLGWVLLVVVCYAPLFMARRGETNGQSPGKQLFGLRVVTEDSSPVDFRRAVRREALGKGPFILAFCILMPFSLPILAVDFYWSRIRPGSRRTLHDQVGRTYVLAVSR